MSMKNAYQSIPQQNEDDLMLKVPDTKAILNFALPAMGIYLCSPLLSMIDTSTVGLFCGTLQQAALNPAVTITDYSARAMSFLYIGTTNMIAASKENSSPEDIKSSFVGSLRLSLYVGLSLAVLLLLISQSLLIPLVGNKMVDIELLQAAWRYIAIRSIGMPAAAMIGTSQAACLGLQDNRTPFLIILATAFLNLFLDVLLVGRKAVWVGGTAGAAWATMISQYFALGLFLKTFTCDQKHDFSSNHRENISISGLLKDKLSLNNFFWLPGRKTINDFSPYVIPVTTTQIGRCSTYIAMSHVVSSSMDTVSLAAQQIISSVFYALIPIGDSCSITAQTFLPILVSKDPSYSRTKAIRKTISNIFKVASIMGIFLSVVALSIPLGCPFLTSNPRVIECVRNVVPAMLMILSTHGIFCASEGILIGFGDLKFLGRIYAFFFVVVPMLMLKIKHSAHVGKPVSLVSVWNVFLSYQAFRISSFLMRGVFVRHRFEKMVRSE